MTSFPSMDGSLPVNPLDFLEHQVGAGVYCLDIATQAMTWSRGVYDVLNLVPGEVTPSRTAIRDLIHPDDKRPLDEMDRMYSSGNSFKIEYRIIMRDRRLRWISNQGEFLMDPHGKPSLVFGVLRDITAAHVAADLLEDYRTRLNAFLKLSTAIAWTASPDGYLTSVHDWKNAFACDEEPLGLKLLDIMHPDDREGAQAAWGAAVANGEHYSCEHRLLDRGGVYRWWRCKALPVKTPDGRTSEWLGVTIDIHDEKTGNSIKNPTVAATGAQIRAARSILRLSVKQLSDESGVPVGTIRRIEDIDGVSGDDTTTSRLLRAQLEKQGAVFIFPAGLKPAVCPA